MKFKNNKAHHIVTANIRFAVTEDLRFRIVEYIIF